MNVGFVESSSQHDWNCFIFHDVDLLPLDHRISYSCTESPAHLSSAIDKFNESLPYPHYFGGVCAFTKQDYLSVNGASNRYWGWGGEDDDLYHR
ncbi:unnamed protein product [Auanema sp. JU1783]|nr:unnamed protein product [Auanema sp. JU1783]